MRNYRTTLVGICCLLHFLTYVAVQGQSCRDLTIPIERDDSSTIVVGEFINNADIITNLRVVLRNSSGGIVDFENNATSATTFRFYACPHVGRNLTLHAESNGAEICRSAIRLHEDFLPIILGRDTTVWCDDTLTNPGVHLDDQPPIAIIPCQGQRPSAYTGDWKNVFPCNSDTAMVIYKMYEAFAKDGSRATGQDTVVVMRFPPITDLNFTCDMSDTIACDTLSPVGPVLTLPDREIRFVEAYRNLDGTLNFKAIDLDPACGISTVVNSEAFNSECPRLYNVKVQIKQTCSSAGDEGYFTCDFWVAEIDTTAPGLEILRGNQQWIVDTLLAPTTNHDCSAQVFLPPLQATDQCHSVEMAKVIVEGHGSFVLEQQADGTWSLCKPFALPFLEKNTRVIFEATDQCHLVNRDTIYVRVLDESEPVAASTRMLNLSLTGKKSWVDASTVNQGSWDNCSIERLLVRRVDWKEACMDLCADFDFTMGDLDQNYLQHLDSLGEVASHYAETMRWLALDPGLCNDLLLRAWLYDLHHYQSTICQGNTEVIFEQEINSFFPNDELLDDAKLLGGGWSDAVPFSCEDLCDTVKVELLVMDYWCNWNKTWSNIYVEDKTPVTVAQPLDEEIDISCYALHDVAEGQDKTIDELVALAQNGDPGALEALNQIFGGYRKAWLGNHGDYVDLDGIPIKTDLDFINTQCDCRDTMAIVTATNDHGQTVLKDSTWRICDYYTEELSFTGGILLVNCPDLVECRQEVWTDLDDCGIGTIYRKFTITAGCAGQNMIPIELTQHINVFDRCALDPGMFRFPADTEIESCGLIYESDGSGNIGGPAHPDSTGRPEFLFDSGCYLVGIGYTDKPLEIVPQEEDGPCYKIVRTWCMIDWCGIQNPSPDWQNNPSYADQILKYTQYIKVFCECPCLLNCENLQDTAIACVDIPQDLTELYQYFDVPTIESPDTTQPCDGTLDNKTEIDTNSCGIGQIVRTWYLIDPLNQVVDSCKQAIVMDQPPIEIERTNYYPGDAEPFNCSDSIITEPVEFDFSSCPLFGDVVISNDSPYAVNDSNDASGVYPVGEWIVTYTISSSCFVDIQEVDTINVIDDVSPLVIAFSDPCVSKSEWENDFQNNPLNPEIRNMLGVMGTDNCGIDTVFLVDLDSMFFPDADIRDSILYTYDWQALDIYGNLSDIKTTTILVSDLCTVSADIQGVVLTENQQPVSEVMIKAMGDDGILVEYPADVDGKYAIEPWDLNSGIMVQPIKDSEPRNGLSTADIIHMQNHILGIRPLQSEFQEIAADINNDGRITALDLIQLRKMILGTIDHFPESHSWRFVNDLNGMPEYHVGNFDQRTNLNFTGIKIGDIDQSGDPGRSNGRSRDHMVLEVENQILQAGDEVTIPLRSSEIQRLKGMQFTLQYDPDRLRLLSISELAASGFGPENYATMTIGLALFQSVGISH